MKSSINLSCPLCLKTNVSSFIAREIEYHHCQNCHLVFKDKKELLDNKTEKSRYDFHENVDNPGYREFLGRLFHPLMKYLNKEMKGMDFGCGPGPVLQKMFHEEGINCQVYDPFYSPEMPNGKFDFITSTEVVEHFFEPGKEFDFILSKLKAGGYLGLMTSLYENDEQFETWHYCNDDTHVSFYHHKTMEWIASNFNLEALHISKQVHIFRKLGTT
jgi:SAM-dependent methyltransferase